MSCPLCFSPETEIRLEPNASPHYAREICASCGTYIRFVGKPDEKRERRSAGHIGLVKRYGRGYCEMCLRPAGDVVRSLTGHHVVPHKMGGSSNRDNVWIVCGACHAAIHHVRTYYGQNEPPEAE